mmetsp:Transcript_20002/g.46557  ORF Transcript_20002/g.46557 Transcript_20002/m.46557 type:complete len:242 (-) Transcript_20002:158-883(-)
MSSCSEGGDTVVVNVGGEKFQVLRQTIAGKPETLLCTLLDDPAHKAKQKTSANHAAPQAEEIFVEADPKRFRYILDWYRYGSICVPNNMSVQEMRRECAFFQLPDNLKISRERPSSGEAVASAVHALVRARCDIRGKVAETVRQVEEAKRQQVAMMLLEYLLEKEDLCERGHAALDIEKLKSVVPSHLLPAASCLSAAWGENLVAVANLEAQLHGWMVKVESAYGCVKRFSLGFCDDLAEE